MTTQIAALSDVLKPDIFRKRVNIKPLEYPDLMKYKDAIRHSYWLHTDFNYDPDIQDMRVKMKPHEVQALKRTMLAISQIENKVKTFWGTLEDSLPKPEISDVGATFAESEVRHKDAYAELLEKLGINDEFEHLTEVPAIRDRMAYIDKVNTRVKTASTKKEFLESLILFSMLIEYVSLFSQFYIIMALNKFDNVLKGMSNAVEATSKEEDQHAYFGFELVNIIKTEHPEFWTQDLIDRVYEIVRKAYAAEMKVLDWVYEGGDLSAAPKDTVLSFVANRLNESLRNIGLDDQFEVSDETKNLFQWFEDEVIVTKHNDFFQKRSTNYTARTKAVTAEDLF